MMQNEIGPIVWCSDVGHESHTHRPIGSDDPWFCFYCGGDHDTIDTTN